MGGLNDFKCFYLLHFLYIAGVGVNPGNLLCTTCVRPGCKRHTVGGIWGGGDFEIKIYKINSFSLFYFMSKMSKIQYMECNALNSMHVKDVEDIKNTCIVVSCANVEDIEDI